jgi:hypothetical protein
MKHFPFKVINKGGKPVIQVEYRGETKDFVIILCFLPYEISKVLCIDA